MKRTAFSTALMLGLAACGGGESADTGAADTAAEAPAAEASAAAAGEMTMPSWYRMDGNAVTRTRTWLTPLGFPPGLRLLRP